MVLHGRSVGVAIDLSDPLRDGDRFCGLVFLDRLIARQQISGLIWIDQPMAR